MRYPGDLRDSPETLRRVLIATPTGAQIPVEAVATIQLRRGPPVIKSEDARPNAWIYVDLKTLDIGGFVARAKRVVAEREAMPLGYTLVRSGQLEYMERAEARLRILVPIMLSSGTGFDVTHRVAAPMLGGMLTVMILNLQVLPVVYSWFCSSRSGVGSRWYELWLAN